MFYIYSGALLTVCFIFTVVHYSLYVLYLQWCIIHCMFYIYSDALFTVCFILTVMHYSLYVLYLQ